MNISFGRFVTGPLIAGLISSSIPASAQIRDAEIKPVFPPPVLQLRWGGPRQEVPESPKPTVVHSLFETGKAWGTGEWVVVGVAVVAVVVIVAASSHHSSGSGSGGGY